MATYLLPKARNTTSGQTVKNQDLTGARLTLRQMSFAQEIAEQLARKMTIKTGETWEPLVVEYEPSERVSADVPVRAISPYVRRR
jgi:hypothetical protein